MPLLIDKLAVTSPTIAPLGAIPVQHSADGQNQAPMLDVQSLPDGTVELALICHDPDAPLPNGFTHWVVYGLPATAGTISVDASGTRQGPNGLGDAAWTGPQPPVGHGTHHYYFWVYALNRVVEGEPTREDFLAGYADAVIEQARLVGTFQR